MNKTNVRDVRFTLLLTTREKRQLAATAKASGLTVSDLIRTSLLYPTKKAVKNGKQIL